jgi:hypothetical protein
MRARTLFLTTFALLLGSPLLAPDAQAAKTTNYSISEELAKSLCKKEGGGFINGTCSFCHPGHCHVIGGCKNGKCSNTVHKF